MNSDVLRCVSKYLEPRQLVMMEELKKFKFVYDASESGNCMSAREFNYLFSQFDGISVVGAKISYDGYDVRMGKYLKDLVYLFVYGNINLGFVCGCRNLRYVHVWSNNVLVDLESLRKCSRLKCVNINLCENLVDVSAVGNFVELRQCCVYACEKVRGCENIDFSKCRKLQFVEFPACNGICNVDFLDTCVNLRILKLYRCENLVGVKVHGLRHLRKLDLSGCSKLRNVDELEGCRRLASVNLEKCGNLRKVKVGSLGRLRKLNLNECVEIVDVELGKCEKLKSLRMRGCVKLRKN